jgi:hypothetical protein
MPNNPPSLYSASTSCSAVHNESGTLEIEGAEGQIRQEDSGFLSCWEEGGEKVSMANFALIRVLGKGGQSLTNISRILSTLLFRLNNLFFNPLMDIFLTYCYYNK